MATWADDHRCTDCGKGIPYAGTCADCLVKNQPVPEKLKEDLKRGS